MDFTTQPDTVPVDNGRLLFPLQQLGSFALLAPASEESTPGAESGPGPRWWPAQGFAPVEDEVSASPTCIDRAKALCRPPETTR